MYFGKMMKKLNILFICINSICIPSIRTTQPILTVVIVVDQFAYHYLSKIKPYLRGGLKTMMDKGIVYQNAYFPHGSLATATGHAGLSTGTYARDHGFIANRWFNKDGTELKADDDDNPQSQVFLTDPTKFVGKSAHMLMTDTISDQFVLSAPKQLRPCYSISLKSRAAVATAGKLGLPIWFEQDEARFTSSKAYFPALPSWIDDFNKKTQYQLSKPLFWQSVYPPDSVAYQMVLPDSYQFVEKDVPRINQPIIAKLKQEGKRFHAGLVDAFVTTPAANALLFDLALKCIDHEAPAENKQMLLWLCLSSLDKIGHFLGPDSFEIIDMLYHFDHQLNIFLKKIEKKFGQDKVLFAITADHGATPIPELMQKKGYPAKRIYSKNITQDLNKLLEKNYGLKQFIIGYHHPYFYFDQKQDQLLSPEKRCALEEDLKQYLQKQPGKTLKDDVDGLLIPNKKARVLASCKVYTLSSITCGNSRDGWYTISGTCVLYSYGAQ